MQAAMQAAVQAAMQAAVQAAVQAAGLHWELPPVTMHDILQLLGRLMLANSPSIV